MDMRFSASTSSTTLGKQPINPNGDLEVTEAPKKNILSMSFGPDNIRKTILAASSQDDTLRLWQLEQDTFFPIKVLETEERVLDICWSVDGKKIYMASRDHKLNCLDLESEVSMEHEAHLGPVTTCNLVRGPPYESCIMTGSCDKTIKVWDLRQKRPVDTACVNNRVACVDVDFPYVVVCTPHGAIYNYQIRNRLQMVRQIVPPYKSETLCVAILKDKKTNVPNGYVVGIPEGHLFAIYDKKPQRSNTLPWLNSDCPKSVTVLPGGKQSNAVSANDIKRHPVHETLAVVRSDGMYSFWDTEPDLIKFKISKKLNQPLTKCCFDTCGFLFAYSTGCVRSERVLKKPNIYCNISCFSDMTPTPTKK